MTPFEQKIIEAPCAFFHQPSDFPDPIGLIAELQRENAELKEKLAASEQSDAASMRALIEVTREKEAYRLAAERMKG